MVSPLHDATAPAGLTSQIASGTPPAIATRHNFPPALYPTDAPSDDQNGANALSVPSTLRTAKESSARRKSACVPFCMPAKQSVRPSGDSAKFGDSGDVITVVTAGGTSLRGAGLAGGPARAGGGRGGGPPATGAPRAATRSPPTPHVNSAAPAAMAIGTNTRENLRRG